MAEEVKRGKLSDLTPDRRNANKGTKRGLGALDHSLRQYGAGRSILIDKHGNIIAGNKTIERAADIGLDDVIIVPTDGTQIVAVQRTDLDLYEDKQARELAYADNRVASLDLDWNAEEMTLDIGAGIDLSPLFTDKELAELGVAQEEPKEDAGAQEPSDSLTERWAVEPGQIWQLGAHRLAVGDCTDAELVARLMGEDKADMLLNDPPYGMRLDADFSGMVNNLQFAQEKGVKNGKKYANVIGDHEDYNAAPVVALFAYVKEQFWWGADYYSATLGDTMHEGAWLVWDKRLDESADRMYGSCFELLWSKQKHKRDMLRHKWAGIFGTEKEPTRGRVHPNQKPVELYEDILTRYSDGGAVIVDCYAGSGTTIIACERTGRTARACEISPDYVATILERYKLTFGITPILA